MTVGAPHREADTIAVLLEAARSKLAPLHESPRLDAELILAHVLGRPRSHLYAWPQRRIDAELRRRFESLIERRAAGEPVAYLLGRREFWSLELEVGAATLVPRPETELLVELALSRLPASDPCRVLDLGTGSGAIALALSTERPQWSVTAVEASAGALAIARRNRERLRLNNLTLLRGDWYTPVTGRHFELIVSNPPYVRRQDPRLTRGDLRHEPRSALDGGPDGLISLARIIAGTANHLSPEGLLIVEHGPDQADSVRELAAGAGLVSIESHRDLAGLTRATSARCAAQ
jgi:release factor glutamine methyltransferase